MARFDLVSDHECACFVMELAKRGGHVGGGGSVSVADIFDFYQHAWKTRRFRHALQIFFGVDNYDPALGVFAIWPQYAGACELFVGI